MQTFRYIFKISDSRNIFGTHFVGNMNEILDSLPWFIFNKSLWNGLFELEFNYPRNIFISDDLPEITLIYCHVLRLIWFFLLLILYQVIYQVISISISNLFFLQFRVVYNFCVFIFVCSVWIFQILFHACPILMTSFFLRYIKQKIHLQNKMGLSTIINITWCGCNPNLYLKYYLWCRLVMPRAIAQGAPLVNPLFRYFKRYFNSCFRVKYGYYEIYASDIVGSVKSWNAAHYDIYF